jgi:hypothetical protein
VQKLVGSCIFLYFKNIHRKYKASFHRLMSLAVYFACCTPICFQAPYEVSLDDVQVELLYDVVGFVYLHNNHNHNNNNNQVAKTQHLCAINGNFVGLCVADKVTFIIFLLISLSTVYSLSQGQKDHLSVSV